MIAILFVVIVTTRRVLEETKNMKIFPLSHYVSTLSLTWLGHICNKGNVLFIECTLLIKSSLEAIDCRCLYSLGIFIFTLLLQLLFSDDVWWFGLKVVLLLLLDDVDMCRIFFRRIPRPFSVFC
jgi:hypothetical protein